MGDLEISPSKLAESVEVRGRRLETIESMWKVDGI
jgi:hypothetical protein